MLKNCSTGNGTHVWFRFVWERAHFLNLCQITNTNRFKNHYAIALQHIVTNKKILIFVSAYCLTAKVSNLLKSFRSLLRVNQKLKGLCLVNHWILAGSERVKGHSTKTNWKRLLHIPNMHYAHLLSIRVPGEWTLHPGSLARATLYPF